MSGPSTSSGCASHRRAKIRVREGVSVDTFGSIEDWKVLRAAYRLGALPAGWKPVPGLDADAFQEAAEAFVARHFDYGWAVRGPAHTLVVAFGMQAGPMAVVGDAVWHPKTTPRARLEAGFALFDALRRQMPFLVTSRMPHKRFYERLVDAGVLRRVGSLYGLYGPSERVALFQGRGVVK